MTEQPISPDALEFDVADRLRKTLRHSQVSSQQMSEYLEVSRHTISNWLNGHTRPRPAELKMWAMRVGVPYEWLATGDKGSNRTAIMQDPPSTGEIVGHAKPITDPDTVAALRHSLGYTTRTGRRAAPRSAR